MNHDYAHCADYDSSCPKDCFRAALTKDLKNYHYPVSFMNFKGTEECPLYSTNRTNSAIGGEKRTNGDAIRSMTDEEMAEWRTEGQCPTGRYIGDYDCEFFGSCRICWLDWLKQDSETIVKGAE